MFPDYFRREENIGKTRHEILDCVFIGIKQQISAAYAFCESREVVDTESLAYALLGKISVIKEALIKDVQAIYE